MITHDKIGLDEDLAREIILIALDIAPCLATFPDDSEPQKNALAVLRRVYKGLAPRGSQLVKSQRTGSSSVEYFDIQNAFAGQPTRALRALCSPAAASDAGHSRGSFPKERPIGRVWKETY